MLEIQGLRKEYGDLTAVRDLWFTLKPGDVFGFIGSNGAGKTTTIKMLATLLEPDRGTAILNGADVRRQPMDVRRMIGYMPDFFGLYDDVKVWEYLDYFAAVYKIPARMRNDVIDNVLQLTDLTVKRDSFVQGLSRGMQQRLCLARCLVHDPSLLLLDEPASGLDPRARAELKELIAELGRMGKIVIVSSHILTELAGFCNTIGVMEKGELLAFGPVDEVTRKAHHARLLEIRMLERTTDAARLLRDRPDVKVADAAGDGTVRVEFVGDTEGQADLLRLLVEAGHRPVALREKEADLEDVFLKLTTGAVN